MGRWDLLPGNNSIHARGRFRLDFGKIPPGKGLAQRNSGIFVAGNHNEALTKNPFEAGSV